MINSVPKKLFGTLICAAALWTTFTPNTVHCSDKQSGVSGSKNHSNTNPQYKRYLNLMGSWFLGDQIRESAVWKGVGGSQPNVVQHLYSLLPILKRSEILTKREDQSQNQVPNTNNNNNNYETPEFEYRKPIKETIEEIIAKAKATIETVTESEKDSDKSIKAIKYKALAAIKAKIRSEIKIKTVKTLTGTQIKTTSQRNRQNRRNHIEIIEYALTIYEKIVKLADPKLTSVLKNAGIIKLYNDIFTKVGKGETVLIPVVWKGTKPGSLLMTLEQDKHTRYSGHEILRLRVYDTFYTFKTNKLTSDYNSEYPHRIVPWREIICNSADSEKYKLLVPGLVALMDENQMNGFYLEDQGNFIISYVKSIFSPSYNRDNTDIGRLYLNSVILPIFGNLSPPPYERNHLSWPLSSLEIGPVGDILAYFTESADDYKDYSALKLEIGYEIIKTFLKRFSSDSDIHRESRSRIVVTEILKKSANRLLRDAFEVARIQEWIPNQIGEADNDFWKHIHFKDNPNRDLIESYKRRFEQVTKYGFFKRTSAEADFKNEKIEFALELLTKNYIEITGSYNFPTKNVKDYLSVLFDFDQELHVLESQSKKNKDNLENKLKALVMNMPKNGEIQIESIEEFIKEFTEFHDKKKSRESYVKNIHELIFSRASKLKMESLSSVAKNQVELKLIHQVMKLRESAFNWIKEKSLDTHKLTKITRSLGQREMPVKQKIRVSIDSTLQKPIDLTDYKMGGKFSSDFSNCMSGIDITIKSLKDFINAFVPMKSVWKWSKFRFEVKDPQCESFFRRNSELLLKKLVLGGLDKESLNRWAPANQKEYNQFNDLCNVILNTVSTLPSMEKTLEDYLIVMRIQRVIWRVAQALDAKFAVVEPQRHLDLAQYSLSYPKCRNLLENRMTYDNYFLADSGAFGNILSYESVAEMKELCKTLLEEENSGKPVLNHDKYSSVFPNYIDFFMFDSVDDGDREIFFKMAQNPKIAQTVRENLKYYNYGDTSVSGNAARAAGLGYIGSQFIYYQFFDALKLVFTANMAFGNQVSSLLPIKLTAVPALGYGSILLVLPTKDRSTTELSTVNEELLKNAKKSYLKISLTEMLTSHILGLDVVVNHLGHGSAKFWSTGSIIEENRVRGTFLDSIIHSIEDLTEIVSSFQGKVADVSGDRFKIKAFRRDVAGSADFFLNCSAHLIRKLDVAPDYEELVMTLLMKAFASVEGELEAALKELEKQDSSFDLTDKEVADKVKNSQSSSNEMEENENYLKSSKLSPDARLKSLINWATIAIRFAARIRSLKPEWKDRYADIPKHFYKTMIKYSRIRKANNRRLAHLDKKLISHVDYLLFMVVAVNPNDHNLRFEIHENLKPEADLPEDSSVLPSAMILHRILALSQYEYDHDGPLTEDFISHQFGITRVMEAISLVKEQNESFLKLMANYMSPFLALSAEEIFKEHAQGDNLAKGALIYGRFFINMIEGTFIENGVRARDPNAVLRYRLFRDFFSSGNEQIVPNLGRETNGCTNRYEVDNFLVKGGKYSICENTEMKMISIYRQIPKFRRPCLLVRRKRVITALQSAFSVFTNQGVDLYQCTRGNNAHFVWIKRNAANPSYVSHGRLSNYNDVLVESVYGTLGGKLAFSAETGIKTFELDLKTKLIDENSVAFFDMGAWKDFLILPAITFPKLEIRDVDDTPVFPLTGESKRMIVPEPMVRFSGGSCFGSYTLKNKLIFMFQQFRFRDRPEVSMTFIEGADGSLEMKGREDLKVCEDQIFENNFWPALMLRKTGESGERRFAYVPITNSEAKEKKSATFQDEISVHFDTENVSAGVSSDLNDSLIFMEEYPVEKYPISEINTDSGKTHVAYAYRLKPTSRLQRLLLAFHNLRLRNYDACLKLLDPRSEIDHNTPLNDDEFKILDWMVKYQSGQEPEALALRLMAKIHIILDLELFPGQYDPKSGGSSSGNSSEDFSDAVITNNETLLNIYKGKSPGIINYDKLDVSRLDTWIKCEALTEDLKLGRYFAVLPLLPKRFHIDQVFREAMSSRHIQIYLITQYQNGIMYPEMKPLDVLPYFDVFELIQSIFSPNQFGKSNHKFTIKKCDYKAFLKDGKITRKMLAPLTAAEEEKLNKSIKDRYILPYAAFDCDLPRFIVQKLLRFYNEKNAKNRKKNTFVANREVDKGLQELAMFRYYLSGYDISEMDRYAYALSRPNYLNFNWEDYIDFEEFEKELDPKYSIKYKDWSSDYLLDKLSSSVLNYVDARNLQPEFDPKTIDIDRFQKTNADSILQPLLPKAPSSEVSAKEREINSIKFMTEDLHYITEADRKIYQNTIEKINEARLTKEATNELKLVGLKATSKTQKGLQIAISDYLDKRTEPIEYDNLNPKLLFVDLKNNIGAKIETFSTEMRRLEAKYARFYRGTIQAQEKGHLLPATVLSSLKRAFNNNGVPTLKDLRDCFMQMSRSCLRHRLPEMPETSIVKIAQVLKTYYIQTIIFNNLNAINDKIKNFEQLAENAAKAEKKLEKYKKLLENQSSKANEIQDIENEIGEIKDEIFDHKDTALLSVEDIYVDMDKLLQLEQRLKDPVTLNFEFMSAKFHLTKMQVMDVANLASRNWEEELKIKVFEEYSTEILNKIKLIDETGNILDAFGNRIDVKLIDALVKRYGLTEIGQTDQSQTQTSEQIDTNSKQIRIENIKNYNDAIQSYRESKHSKFNEAVIKFAVNLEKIFVKSPKTKQQDLAVFAKLSQLAEYSNEYKLFALKELARSTGLDDEVLEKLIKSVSDEANSSHELLIEKYNEIWAYIPRTERQIKNESVSGLKKEYYKKRPVLEQFKEVGELQPYETEKDAYFSRVIQRKMAAGKTTVLGTAATVKKADGKTLSVLVILSALYQSSAPDMQKRTSEFFNTRGFAFSMPKPRLTIPKAYQQDHPARSFLLWTLKTLINTINSNSYLVVTPETLQSFLNSYVEFLDAFVNTPGGRLNPELSRCLQLFATIYDIFRSRGSVILDEIDSSMRPQKELNFPTTKREGILLSGVELTSDLLLYSALNTEIKEAGLNLLANQQAALNDDQYKFVYQLWREYVSAQLENENSIWYKTFSNSFSSGIIDANFLIKFFFDPSLFDRDGNNMTEEERQELEAEIDKLADIKQQNKKSFHAMMVVKMQLKNWLRSCFKGSVNEHYGPSINRPGQKPLYYAIPYMAANTPAEGSIFADRWETVNKTFMMYLVKNFNLEDLSMILLDLRTFSQSNAQGLDIKKEFIEACPDFDILTLKFNAQNMLIDRDGKVMECMKARSSSSLKLIFYWVTKRIFESEQFFAEQITSNAINLTTMFPSVQGYSGTIDNVNILPHQVMIEAEIDHRKNEQANGAIAMKLLQQKDCVTTVQKIENITKIDELLDAMCRDFPDLSVFSAFIDAGALLKDFSNAEVAFALGRKFKRDIILFYDERTNQLSFHDPKNGPKHMTALEGSETKYLNSATNSVVKNRFTYYDQRHITGSDILQPPTAKAFLTIGPKVLLRDILQGVMRMRQFQSGQSIHFITTSAVETLLSKYCEEVKDENENSPGKPRVDQRHLIALGALNEDEKQLNENLRLYRVKIDAEIRAFVLDQITDALAQTDPFKERALKANQFYGGSELIFSFDHEDLFKRTRSLFIRNVQENPVNWASLNILTKTEEAVQQYADQKMDLVPEIWKSTEKWEKVEENLKHLIEPITEEDKKDEKKLVQKARSVLNYLDDHLVLSKVDKKFAKSDSQATEQGNTIEMELQLELQQELELHLDQKVLTTNNVSFLAEPIIEIPQLTNPITSLSRIMSAFTSSPAANLANYALDIVGNTEIIESIDELLTPWKLLEEYGRKRHDFVDVIKVIYQADILCPGLNADENNISKISEHCKNITGFVGLSKGLAKVTTSNELDFVTMSSREGTHLLFWRGSSDTPKGYKYAVFLISGSEALSIHKHWSNKSCSMDGYNAFWLTDLYGFEIHGAPFASKTMSSNHFSLLEREYEENFEELHFRALILNGSYNVIMTNKNMYDLMRGWIGDPSIVNKDKTPDQPGVKRETILKRVNFFINRLSWMSKMRDEIVPDDPFIRDIIRVHSNQTVDFEETASKYKEDLNRGQTEIYSDKMESNLIDPENEKAKPWKASKNINKAKSAAFFNNSIIILVISALIGIFVMWSRNAGIIWSEFLEAKRVSFVAFIKNAVTPSESTDAEEAVGEPSEYSDQIVPSEPIIQENSIETSEN